MTKLTTMTAALLTLTLMGCGKGEALPTVSFEANGAPVSAALVSDTVVFRFSGFEPGSQVTVRAQMADGSRSWATFVADEAGGFDTTRIPLSGSYSGADADGLFYSMEGRIPEWVTSGAVHVVISAELDGNEVLRQRLERYTSRELMAVPGQDLCGGLACPERKTPGLLPQDPVPLR